MALYRKKVCLVGPPAVGKTSLVARFVNHLFSERYLQTLGTRVYSKTIPLAGGNGETPDTLVLAVWDIMGQEGLRQLLQEAYFFGAHGVLAVGDLTRPETIVDLEDWIVAVRKVAGDIPVQLAANKVDLVGPAGRSNPQVEAFVARHGGTAFLTSAKTGEGVEEAFRALSASLLPQRALAIARR